MQVIKGNRFGIGGDSREGRRIFTQHRISLAEPTMIYLFSDGFQDQFSGDTKRKFMSRNFYDLLHQVSPHPLHVQKQLLLQAHQSWKAGYTQIDDILVLGCKINLENS
jgi:hypothetical protein